MDRHCGSAPLLCVPGLLHFALAARSTTRRPFQRGETKRPVLALAIGINSSSSLSITLGTLSNKS